MGSIVLSDIWSETPTNDTKAETLEPRKVSTIEHLESITTESALEDERKHFTFDSSYPHKDSQLSEEYYNIVIHDNINTPSNYTSQKEMIT